MTRVLIFIDESGNPWEQEATFIGAAIWCIPATREGFQSTLRYTQDQTRLKIKEMLGKIPNEVHYSDGLRRHSREIIDQKSLEDNSIVRKDFLWARHPVGCSIAVFNPKIEHAISPCIEFPNILRARTIATLLMPILNYHGVAPIEVSVILDSDCWKNSLTYCSRKLEELCKLSSIAISFSCKNSNRVPGVQIADFFAGITKDYYMMSTYQNLMIFRLNIELLV